MDGLEKNNKGGQPKKVLSSEEIIQVEALAACLTATQIADYFGFCENTFRAIQERQPLVLEAYKRGKSRAIESVASNLLTQAKEGNLTAAIFYLKTQGKWREQIDINQTVRKPRDFKDFYSDNEPES